MTGAAREAMVRFADRLRRLRLASGAPPLKRLADLTAELGRPLARSTISDKLTAKSLPEWDFVVWFVHGCVASARRAGARVPADLTDLAGWDAAHWRLLRALDEGRAGDRLTAAARAEIARRTGPPADPSRPSGPVETGVVPRQLPATTRHFAARAVELATLTELADEAGRVGPAVVIAAITGTAGIGKTALVVHWAHQAAGRFPDGQLYVDLRGFGPAESPTAPAEAVGGFLEALGVPAGQVPAGLDTRTALYRSLLAGRRMLVVLDNARDTEQVRRLLPGSPGCLILVTSRCLLAGLIAVEGAQPLTLDLLTVAEALELLTGRLGRGRLAAEPAAADDIIAASARLPLALSVVAARAASQPGFSLSALAAELRATGLDAFDSGESGLDVRSAFSWSYRRLDTPAAAMFRLLGTAPGPDIGLVAAASLAGVPVDRAGPVLTELARTHLVAETAPGRFALHDLLRAYAAELATTVDSPNGVGDRAGVRWPARYAAADRSGTDPARLAIR